MTHVLGEILKQVQDDLGGDFYITKHDSLKPIVMLNLFQHLSAVNNSSIVII